MVRRLGFWLIVLVLYGLATGLVYLGAWPLGSHEALAAERTRELMTVGGWGMPHLNGEPDARKPPLPFWIGGLIAVAAGGVSEWTARFPSVLASLGTMILVVVWMNRLTNLRTAVITGVVYLTSMASLLYGRRAEVDMQLCFWTTAALTGYWFALMAEVRRRQRLYAALMWISLALAVLTKGPLPVAIVAATALVMAVLCTEGRRVRRLLPLLGPLLFLAVIAPWGVWVLRQWPQAAAVWYDQSLGRYAGQLGHYEPWHYYITHTALLWLPWAPLVILGFYLAIRRRVIGPTVLVYLLAWGIGSLVFLSFGVGKRLHYALPALPPFLILGGLGAAYLVDGLRSPLSKSGRWIVWGLLLGGLAAVGGGTIYAMRYYAEFSRPSIVLGGLAALGWGATLMAFLAGRRLAAIGVFAGLLLILHVASWGLIIAPIAVREETECALGRWIASELKPETDVRLFLEPSARVIFYAGRSLPVLLDAEAVHQWRVTHPDGCLVLVDRAVLQDFQRQGGWEQVYPPPGEKAHGPAEIAKTGHHGGVLRAVGGGPPSGARTDQGALHGR